MLACQKVNCSSCTCACRIIIGIIHYFEPLWFFVKKWIFFNGWRGPRDWKRRHITGSFVEESKEGVCLGLVGFGDNISKDTRQHFVAIELSSWNSPLWTAALKALTDGPKRWGRGGGGLHILHVGTLFSSTPQYRHFFNMDATLTTSIFKTSRRGTTQFNVSVWLRKFLKKIPLFSYYCKNYERNPIQNEIGEASNKTIHRARARSSQWL